MKRFTFLLLSVTLAALAACDDSDVYYSTVYPVVRVEAEVTRSVTPPAPGEEDEGEGEGEPTEDPALDLIRQEVLAAAPVSAGGRYVLDFVRFDGGRLTVYPAEGAEPVAGTFAKTPGQTDLTFEYGGMEAYTCKVSTYTADDGAVCAVLSIDLTAHYQALYPDAPVAKVLRREYTTHNRY